MSLSQDLDKRGFIKDRTFEDLTFLDKPQTFYLGVDAASADSMTIGNLAVLLMARRLLDAGWQAVLLAGGATSLIGDPKDTEERALKPREEVQKNVATIKEQINKLFAGKEFTPADNYDWFKDIGYLEFLRDVGKNFAMSELMQREFVTERMDSGISYAEFSYSLIQGYDFWHLFKNHGAVLQVGGSDQWGNMLSGVSLVRKKEAKEVHALSMPLVLNKTTGRKFGKSEGGAVWLDPAKTSPTQFYQFWVNVDDADVASYLKIFTLLPLDKIQEALSYHVSSPEERKAQRLLAREVTELVHGKEEAHTAAVVTDVLTGKTSIGEVGEGVVAEVRKEIKSEKFAKPPDTLEALTATGLASSKSEARRLLAGGAVYVDGKAFAGESLSAEDFKNKRLLIRRGKAFKDSALIELK